MPVTMYTTQWCGFCRRLKGQLARVGVEVAEVDIERDEAAAEFVMSVNGGNQTVPTMLFSDGSTMVNPTAAQVVARLTELAAPALSVPNVSVPNGHICTERTQATPLGYRFPSTGQNCVTGGNLAVSG